jgi:hypothetical protein
MIDRGTLPRAVLLAVVAFTVASCVPGGSFVRSAGIKPAPPAQEETGTAADAAGQTAIAPLLRGPLLEALQPGRAVLVDGSRAVKGLPGFGRNALPALSGIYAYMPAGQKPAPGAPPDAPGKSAEDGIIQVSVWFTREPLVFPESWKTPVQSLATCSTLPSGITMPGMLIPDEETSLWAIGATGYTLFIAIPDALPDPCRFASVFTERFQFFQRYAERPEDTSFPAILDIGR